MLRRRLYWCGGKPWSMVPRMIDQNDQKAPDSQSTGEEDTHSFGFEDVSGREKTDRVRDVFSSVAGKYDIMNDAMSLGVHRFWKSAMMDWLRPRPGMQVLDVAGGTGDIATRILDRANGDLAESQTPAQVTVCDINEAMVGEGRDRALNRGRLDGVNWVCGNAESLPVPSAAFDAYTIAFGIRNVTHIDQALREACRVLKPGGRFLCLEFAMPESDLLAKPYDFYSFEIIPRLGGAIAGDRDSYQYLVESIRKFPKPDRFAAMIEDAGLSRVDYRSMSAGLVTLHSARRI
jgi:demethylmenaquinone methyltransferase/2-methoxy-6-polyprenyl-1,4-benzoquinol methylase